MKKISKFIGLIGILTMTSLVLISCNLILNRTSSFSNYTRNDSTNENNKTKYSSFGAGDTVSSLYGNTKVKSEYSTIGKVYTSMGVTTLPSVGKSRLLVVPVEILGYTGNDSYMAGFNDVSVTLTNSLSKTKYYCSWYDLINNAFKGDSTNTGYESLASYYYKSSYGKLTIQPVLTQVFTSQYTYSDLTKNSDSSSYSEKDMSDKIIAEVVDYFFNGSNPIYNYDDFDTNGDGVIDGIWLIYDLPYSSNGGLFWAYTTWYGDGEKSATQQKVSPYCWASKWFLTDGLYAEEPYAETKSLNTANVLADAHTIIHETGHMLGLDDYYDVSSESTRSPAGSLLMMDHNVYDHDPYSKYTLGWIDPTRVKLSDLSSSSSKNYSLRPFESSGDALIVDLPNNTGWIGEEYLIVTYWTPTGLNEKDATNTYEYDNYSGFKASYNPYKGLTESGIQIYHVDARFVKINFRTDKLERFATQEEIKNASYNTNEYFMPAYSNESSISDISNGYDANLIALIDASKTYANMDAKSTNNYSIATNAYALGNEALFKEGNTYDSSYLGKHTFTGGNYFYMGFHGTNSNSYDSSLSTGLKISFGSQTTSNASLVVSKDN